MIATKLFVFVLPLIVIVTQQVLAQNNSTEEKECVDGPSAWYRGTRNYTQYNVPCQRWDASFPHVPNHFPEDGSNHNHCRNPDNDLKGVWCYTMSTKKRWDYCNISKCPDDSRVVWTNYDTTKETSRILSIHADPEVVKTETDRSGTFNVSVMVASNKTFTEFWALAADYQRQLLFYTDYRSEYVGVRNLEHNKTVKRFEGMAHGIESLAYDWVTRNLYWSDSEFKWVMVVDSSFDYYTPVYRSGDDSVHAITIHSRLRKLFFSTFLPLKAKIISTDLAGKNPRVIVTFPSIFDVTGLTVDYTDDRIYYTDYTGYGGLIFSCQLDGSNMKQHQFRGSSVFWSIAAYLEYIYVTDVKVKYDENAEKFYSVWVVPKATDNIFRYTLPGKPRTIAVYSKNEERSFDDVESLGECGNDTLPKCDHICLPRIGHRRECVCSLGYKLVGENKCVVENFYDEFLLIADSGQGKLFQVPFDYNASDPHSYSVVAPNDNDRKVLAVSTNPKTGTIYWSEQRFYSLKSTILTDKPSSIKHLSSSTYASYINVDPCTGNIFLLDSNTKSIKVMNPGGDFVKTIFQADLEKSYNVSMEMIVQDIIYRKIYWSDTKKEEGKGEVWRMNYDGTNVELVYKNLNWPRALTVDYDDRDGTGASLFIAEEKTAMIYETPLKMLETITHTSHQSIPKQHDLAAHLDRDVYTIADIKVHNGILYLMDSKSTNLEKFNLTEGPASLVPFGPPEFFDVSALSIFSKKDSRVFVDCLLSACTDTSCQQICVDIGGPSSATPKCLCNNGFVYSGDKNESCTGKIPNNPPSFGNTCPRDITYTIAECDDHVLPGWAKPVWVNKGKGDGEISEPILPNKLFEGTHYFSYTATNKHSLSSICAFSVNVVAIKCGPYDLPPSMTQTNLTCGYNFGSAYEFRCIDKSMQLYIESGKKSFSRPRFTNMCANTGKWYPYSDVSEMKCKVPPVKYRFSAGPIAGMAIAAAIVVLVLTMILLMRCSKGSPLLIKINFPRIWKRKEDAVTFNNNENQPDNHYSVM